MRLDQSICNNYSCENFNETMPTPISVFPNELVSEVFSHLNLATLGSACCVSKEWKQLADKPSLWKTTIYKEIAFGNDKWAQCFGADVVKDEDSKEEFSSLPWKEFIEDCKKFKSIFPNKKAGDALMLVRLPKTLNGGLTLKSLGELAKNYFPNNKEGYGCMWPDMLYKLGNKSINESCWVVMTKSILPGSGGKWHFEHEKIVANLARKSLIGYKIPDTLESAACILSQYFDSKTRLFSWDPRSLTYGLISKEENSIDFGLGGLNVDYTSGPHSYLGVAALRKF